MRMVFEFSNHIPTFTGSWGVCSAMTAKWLGKVKEGVTILSAADVSSIGSLIINQNKIIDDASYGWDYMIFEIFARFALRYESHSAWYRSGKAVDEPPKASEFPYHHKAFAGRLARPGMYYVSLTNADGERHAIGVVAAAGQGWQLLDACSGLEETDNETDFMTTMVQRLVGYDIVKGKIYKVV